MQTLLVGVFATTAAFLTIKYLRKQIRQQEDFRLEDLERRHVAAKLEALWSLLEIATYNDLCSTYLKETIAQKDTYRLIKGDLGQPPIFPENTISNLAKLTVGLSPENATKVQNFVALMQIRSSRLSSLRDSLAERHRTKNGTKISEPLVLEQAILDYYISKFETNRILGYCRGDHSSIPDLMASSFAREEISSFGEFEINSDNLDIILELWPKRGWWLISK